MAAGSMSAWMEAWEGDLTPSPAARRSAAREAAREAARISARSQHSRYYGREATARVPQPMPDARRREPAPALTVMTRRSPRWGLVALATLFALLVVGSCVIAPVLLHAATTQVETAVGQMEAEQQDLATDTSVIEGQISSLSSPQRVAEQAAKLGLVPAADVSYVATGAVAGNGEVETEVAGR